MFSKQYFLERTGCTVAYFGMRFRQPTASNWNALMRAPVYEWLISASYYKRLRQICQTWKPDILVVSGFWVSLGWKKLRQLRNEFGISVSFDMQGILEELVEYKLVAGSALASRLLFFAAKKAEAALLQHVADHAEVVSQNMADYLRRSYPQYTGPITVVPCGLNQAFDDTMYHQHRRRWSERLGLDPARPSAVYCGSMSKWQRVFEIVEIARTMPQLQMFLFLVGDTSTFPTNLPPNVRIASLPHDTMIEALCAFDFGFLLRRSDWTNLVAFPNKVSEYLNARLTIIVDSKDLGCIKPDYSAAFVRLADADFSAVATPRPAFNLRAILWPDLAAGLLSQYFALTSSWSPSQSKPRLASRERRNKRGVRAAPVAGEGLSR